MPVLMFGHSAGAGSDLSWLTQIGQLRKWDVWLLLLYITRQHPISSSLHATTFFTCIWICLPGSICQLPTILYQGWNLKSPFALWVSASWSNRIVAELMSQNSGFIELYFLFSEVFCYHFLKIIGLGWLSPSQLSPMLMVAKSPPECYF